MTTKWSSQGLNNNTTSKSVNFDDLLKDEFAVILLRGKNVFGDLIYSYVKVALPDLSRLQDAVKNNLNFTASDFGTVIAAGRGEPTDEVKGEISMAYPAFKHPPASSTYKNPVQSQDNTPQADDKKAWDEY